MLSARDSASAFRCCENESDSVLSSAIASSHALAPPLNLDAKIPSAQMSKPMIVLPRYQWLRGPR